VIIITKLLNPKNDYVFKRIFGYTGNEEITKDFLKSILLDNIKEIELDYNPITEKDLFDDKVGILDIKAKLNNNINCNIEMQIVDRKDIEKRLLFYWSKMYTSSIKSGMDYEKLEKSIIILISDYNLENLSEIQGYQTKWNIREEKNRHLVLTDVLEIYIIELEKAKKIIQKENNTLSLWLQFINNPEVVRDMENREIKKAKKILEEISQDKRERRLTELREKYIMDQKAIHNHGYDKGIEVGIKQGKIETAKKMRVKKMTIEEIVELTGLTKEEIEKL
jgi:predicted transposase/invertase (TIGR01784 family)